jgi:hypothetical protein
LSACTTTEYIEVPVYPVLIIEKPAPPALEGLAWEYLPEEQYFALKPEEFDKYRSNLIELDRYIKLLQEGWDYYESVSEPKPQS